MRETASATAENASLLPTPPSERPLWQRFTWVAVALVFLAFAAWQQQRYHAYTRDFATVGDEAAHYVTGVCVRDFFAGGDWTSPVRWARNYYDHYPKVALGHWPPVFYLIQAAWTLCAGASQTSVLILQALLAAAASTLTFQMMRRHLGWALALLLSVSFLASETSRFAFSTVEAEPLMALEFTLAGLAWAHYWQMPGWRRSWLFWGLVTLTVFTKVNGLALFLVPALCIVAAWRWQLLRNLNFWAPAALSALLGVGYNIVTLPLQLSGYQVKPEAVLFRRATIDNLGWTMGVVGPVAWLFLGVTVVLLLSRRLPQEWRPQALAFSAVWVASMLFHCVIVPVDEARHMLLGAPSLLIAASFSIAFFTINRPSWRWALVPVLAASIAYRVPPPMPAPPSGANDLASYLVSQPQWKDATLLVSSPGHGEGALIAAMASRESRPGHTIKRATKVLATSPWNGAHLRLNYNSTAAEQQALDQAHVRLLVIDVEPYERLSMMGNLSRGVAEIPVNDPAGWRRVWPLAGQVSTYRVYERQGGQ